MFDYRNPASRVGGSTARPPGVPGYRIAVASVPGLINWKGVEYFVINRTGGWYQSVLLSDIKDKDDTDYIALGVWFWLGDLDNPHDRRRPHITAVASGSNPFNPQRIGALTARVTYRGHAAGVYAAEEGTPAFRYFRADVRLTGDFKKGLVSGVLTSGTDTATGQPLFGQAKLKGVRIRDPARFQGPVDGTTDGARLQGNWGGRFFSNPDVSTAPPGSVAGTFGALIGNDGKTEYRQQLVADLERYVVSRRRVKTPFPGSKGQSVIPVPLRHSRESGNPGAAEGRYSGVRFPGMTIGWGFDTAASVVSHKYGYEDARAFWLSARRDDL